MSEISVDKGEDRGEDLIRSFGLRPEDSYAQGSPAYADSVDEEYATVVSGDITLESGWSNLATGQQASAEVPYSLQKSKQQPKQYKRLNLFFGLDGKRFARTIEVRPFGRLDEDLRILIGVGQANNTAAGFMKDDAARKTEFAMTIANKGVKTAEVLTPESMAAKLRVAEQAGLVRLEATGPELTGSGIEEVITRTPSGKLGKLAVERIAA